jgi:hypothetical protein
MLTVFNRYLILGFAFIPHLLLAYSVPMGASREEVIAAYGYPASQAKTGGRELMNYKEGAVVLENDQVVEFRFKRSEPSLIKPAAAPQSVPKPALTPEPQQQKPIVIPRPQPYQPAPIPSVQPKGVGIGVWLVFIPAMAIFLIGAVALKYLKQQNGKARRNRKDEFLDYKSTNAATPSKSVEVTRLNRDALGRLEWRRFEELIHGYFETQGWNAQRSRVGADGGIDIFLYRPGQHRPRACVQCKAWHSYTVGVKPVRELLGVMAAENILEGYFVTTSGYTSEALAFAEGKSMKLFTGDDILARFSALPDADHVRIVSHAFRGDFETPTCPSCDKKMIRREAEKPFWGCTSYPHCRQTFKMRE